MTYETKTLLKAILFLIVCAVLLLLGAWVATADESALPVRRVSLQDGNPCRTSLARRYTLVTGSDANRCLAVRVSVLTAEFLHGTGVENGKPAQDQRSLIAVSPLTVKARSIADSLSPELLRDVENFFTKTKHGAFRCIRDLVGVGSTRWVMRADILHRTGPTLPPGPNLNIDASSKPAQRRMAGHGGRTFHRTSPARTGKRKIEA